MKKVLIYPGAFNPPHNGHIRAVLSVLDVHSFDEVWVIPSGQRFDKTISISYAHRRALGETFVEEIQKRTTVPILLKTIELDDTSCRDTSQILNELKSREDIKITQLIGSDGFLNLYPFLLSSGSIMRDSFIIVIRSGYPISSDITQYENISLLEKPLANISSTEIRKKIFNKDKSVLRLLPKNILSYIETHRIYFDICNE